MYKGKTVMVIAPCYNEELKISEVVRRVRNMDVPIIDEMVVADDGSTDNSVNVVRSLGATVLESKERRGVGDAFRRGIDYALEKKYDLCICMAGNNKDEPNEFHRLLDPILDEGYDIVQGSRYLAGGVLSNMPLYRHFATRLHPFLFSLFVGKKVTESTNGFRAFRLSLLSDRRINLHQQWLDETITS